MPREPRSVAFVVLGVETHFPKHFSWVYTEGLKGLGWTTTVLGLGQLRISNTLIEHSEHFVSVSARQTPSRVFGRIGAVAGLRIRAWFRFVTDRKLKDSRIIVVHNDPFLAWMLLFFSRASGRLLVFRLTQIASEEGLLRQHLGQRISAKIACWLRDLVIRRSTVTVTMSDAMSRYLSEKRGLSNRYFVSMPSMVSVANRRGGAHRDCLELAKTDVVQAEGPLSKLIKLIYLGNINARRETEFLYDVVAELKRRGWEPQLTIFGVANSPSDIERMLSYGAQSGVQKNVVLQAPIPEDRLALLIGDYDLGLSPLPPTQLLRTNSLVKNLDYLSAGIGVVASENPDSRFVIEGSGGGVVVRHCSMAFASAIEQWMAMDAEVRNKKSLAAQAWVATHRSLEVASCMWSEILEDVLKGRRVWDSSGGL